MNQTIIALTLSALAIGTTASAAAPVNIRQANQERRIDAGSRSGKLTRHEATALKAQQRSIQRLEARLRARHGGRLTAHDKRVIHARQAQANRAILAQKRDAQRGKDHLKL